MARTILEWGLLLLLCTRPTLGSADLIKLPPPRPLGESAMYADLVVLGTVAEVEAETVGARPYAIAPKAEVVTYRVATIRVAETLVGAGGRTRVRVGFPDGAADALTAGAEGVFFLDPHHSGDFYVRPVHARLFLPKTDRGFDKDLGEVRRVAKVYADPVAALKAKDKEDRLFAAKALVWRYYQPRWAPGGRKWPREDVPAEENKLLLQALAEMPFSRDDPDGNKPSLADNIYLTLEPEKWGFKVPSAERVAAGKRPSPRDRLLEEDWAKFLAENADKVRLQRYVPPKAR